ncbi:hypothetical protein N9176_00040 [bacterium]|jgi:hypothetical protein|nr:hypothetical protein [bacterium]|tara:strand:+ start:1763 stop:1966 length:204 start_codon:yes stop_codon:yes gene_type:complete
MKKKDKRIEKYSKLGIKFIPCDEDSQTYSWQRTNRKATSRAADGPCGAYEVRKIEDVMAERRKRKKK